MPKIQISKSAERWFLNQIVIIADQNPAAARKLLDRFEALRTLLADFPDMTERGHVPGTRKISLPPFILTARRKAGVLQIIAIRHARQKDALAPRDIKIEVADEDE